MAAGGAPIELKFGRQDKASKRWPVQRDQETTLYWAPSYMLDDIKNQFKSLTAPAAVQDGQMSLPPGFNPSSHNH